jgi:hypothetical protein
VEVGSPRKKSKGYLVDIFKIQRGKGRKEGDERNENREEEGDREGRGSVDHPRIWSLQCTSGSEVLWS